MSAPTGTTPVWCQRVLAPMMPRWTSQSLRVESASPNCTTHTSVPTAAGATSLGIENITVTTSAKNKTQGVCVCVPLRGVFRSAVCDAPRKCISQRGAPHTAERLTPRSALLMHSKCNTF